MGSIHSVAHNFQRCGRVILSEALVTEDTVFEFCDKIGFLDMEEVGDEYLIYVPFEKLGAVYDVLGEVQTESIEIFYRPLVTVPTNEVVHAKVENLLDILEDLEDVDKVYTNYA